MRLIFSFLIAFSFVSHIPVSYAGTTFSNGVITSNKSLKTKKPEKRDDMVVDLKSIDLSHLDQIMTRREAIRFERRVGIGAPIERFERYIGMTRRDAIRLVIDEFTSHKDHIIWPSWIENTIPIGFLEEAFASNKSSCSNANYRDSLVAAWSQQIMTNQVPQFERQALFWLDHFSVAHDMYNRSHAFAEHLKIIRQYSNGNFVNFLKASLEDPGIIIYLNNETSTKENPNENLAREFLELFSLGEGQYSENDIRNLAKVLAGNGINFINEKFDNKPSKRTSKAQNGFGQKYKTIDEFLEIIVDHPYFGAFIAKKFHQEYVNLNDPKPEDLAFLVTSFRKGNFEIPALLEATLSLETFWSENNKLTLIKSPVDLLFGTARTLKSISNAGNITWLSYGIIELNQNLFNPPNISGWPTGREWIAGQMIEKRIKSLKKNFSDLGKANASKLKPQDNFNHKYYDDLNDFFNAAERDQLAFEMVGIDWIAKDFGKRKWNDFNLSFYNVRLNGHHYDGINIKFGHDRNAKNRYGDFVEVTEGFSSPDIFDDYNNGWQNKQNGAMVIKFSYPGNKKNKRFKGRSTHEKLMIKRLMQSFKLLLDNKNRHYELRRSPGGIAWMDKMLDEVGFDFIDTPSGPQPPVKQFSIINSQYRHEGDFLCGATKIKFNFRKENNFEKDFFAFKDVKAKAESMDMSLSELLIPDLNLNISNDNYIDILSYEGYQLK